MAARGSQITLEIVAPGVTDIARRIGEDYLANVRAVKLHDMKLEQYVDLLSRTMPSLMQQAAEEYTELREWLRQVYVTTRVRESGISQWQVPEMSGPE